jgi:2-C-methyl-D-erythritol 4-phosphate cytidylyltransferase
MKVQAIIVSGGAGTRLKTDRPKPLVLVGGRPLFIYSVEVFEKSSMIDGIILVVPADHVRDFEEAVKPCGFKKLKKIVIGVRTRCDSVFNGLQALDAKTEIVVVHDGARPLIRPQIVDEAIRQGRTHGAAVVGVPVKPTIKRINRQGMFVEETLNRDELWEIQTPQVFRKDILGEAYAQRGADDSTDDAGLVERLGLRVKVVRGDYENIKITTNEDLIAAEAFLNARSKNP